jgi:hypothetical protein
MTPPPTRWTKKAPVKPGVYRYRYEGTPEYEVYEMKVISKNGQLRVVSKDGHDWSIETYTGEWSTQPLQVPEEGAE